MHIPKRDNISQADIDVFADSLDEHDTETCTLLARWLDYISINTAISLPVGAMMYRISEGPETFKMHWRKPELGPVVSIPKDLVLDTVEFVRASGERWKRIRAIEAPDAPNELATRLRVHNRLFSLGDRFRPLSKKEALIAQILFSQLD